MGRFVLDTNILLAYLRQNEDLIGRINKELGLDHPHSENFISVVSKSRDYGTRHSEWLGRQEAK